MRKRRLFLQSLEKRLVLSGVGQPDTDQTGADWQSVIVSLKDDVANPGASASALMQSFGGQVGHVYEHALKGFSAQLPAAAVKGLSHNPMVKLVEPDLVMTAFGQTVPTGVNRIDAELEYTRFKVVGSGGIVEHVDLTGVDVAIIDTGIDSNHPDLNVVDGVHYYTITGGPPSKRGTFEDGNWEDDNGHGTHVAGTVGALDNDLGVVGVAPGVSLWAVKVLAANGSGNVSDIIKGIDWVTANAETIEIANMSLGGVGKNDAYRAAIQGSVAKGVVYVVAAGNEWRDILGDDLLFGTTDDTIPAAYPEVATISAIADTDGLPGGIGPNTQYIDPKVGKYPDDSFADFSNFSNSDGSDQSWYLVPGNNPVTSPGLGIDLMMPGVDILSTAPGGGYATMSGTSMAAPHAAGLAALHVAQNGRATDAAGVYAIRQALIDSGRPWRDELVLPTYGDSPDKHVENLGWAGYTTPVDEHPSVAIGSPDDGATVSGAVTITATASDDVGVTQVEFFVNGTGIDSVTNQDDTWSVDWNTAVTLDNCPVYPDGTYVITATATDTIGQTTSDSVSVTIDNVDDPPTVEITSPAAGATVSGTVLITADASDDRGISAVVFDVGAETPLEGEDADGDGVWSAIWDTGSYTEATSVTITATATDFGGTEASDSILVTVNNTAQNTAVLSLTSRYTTIGKSGKWQAFVTATVVDEGMALSGATIVGDWSGVYNATGVFGTTDANGSVTFSTPIMTSGNLVTFTVTDFVLAGYTLDRQNSDESVSVGPGAASSRAAGDLDALYQYLAETVNANRQQPGKKNADEQADAVDLLMVYGID